MRRKQPYEKKRNECCGFENSLCKGPETIMFQECGGGPHGWNGARGTRSGSLDLRLFCRPWGLGSFHTSGTNQV